MAKKMARKSTKSAAPDPCKFAAAGLNQLDGDGSEEYVRRLYQSWEKEKSKAKPKAGRRRR